MITYTANAGDSRATIGRKVLPLTSTLTLTLALTLTLTPILTLTLTLASQP